MPVDLWCEAGHHAWQREKQRGRKPRSCPEHSVSSTKPREHSTRKRKARVQKSRPSELRLWDDMKTLIREHRCLCGLRQGMSLKDLRQLNAGCTSPKWVCPALDAYRRRQAKLERSVASDPEAEAL